MKLSQSVGIVVCILAAVASRAVGDGDPIGSFNGLLHGVEGEVYSLNETTLVIKGFKYDGMGPAAVFWKSKSAMDENTDEGFDKCVDYKGSCEEGKLGEFTGEKVVLNFEEGWKTHGYLSVWCSSAGVSFGGVDLSGR